METSEPFLKELSVDADASPPPEVGTAATFNVINGVPDVQLEAFESGTDVTVQVSFPFTSWPMLSADLSPSSPTGSINMPDFAVGATANAINYTNLQVTLQANYTNGQPANVYAALQLDVSLGIDYDPVGTVGANYVLSF
jgi:hypothetical protein